MYSPTLGRFAQPDPIEGLDTNAYKYVGNNPANYVDPQGLQAEKGPPVGPLSSMSLEQLQAYRRYLDTRGTAVAGFTKTGRDASDQRATQGEFDAVNFWIKEKKAEQLAARAASSAADQAALQRETQLRENSGWSLSGRDLEDECKREARRKTEGAAWIVLQMLTGAGLIRGVWGLAKYGWEKGASLFAGKQAATKVVIQDVPAAAAPIPPQITPPHTVTLPPGPQVWTPDPGWPTLPAGWFRPGMKPPPTPPPGPTPSIN